MNVLLITNELGYRGTPRFLVNCAALARQAGHQALVWGLQEGGAAERACAEHGIPVRIGLDALDDALAFAPHVVHVHRAGGVSDRDTALLRVLKRKTGCRILETNVFGSADLTVPDPIDLHAHISRWDLWRWRRWLWPFRRPAIYLPYCVDTAAFRPVPPDAFRRAHGIPGEALGVGRIGKTDWAELRKAVIPALRDCPRVVFVSVDDYSGAAEDFAGWPAGCRARLSSANAAATASSAAIRSTSSPRASTSRIGRSPRRNVVVAPLSARSPGSASRPTSRIPKSPNASGAWWARSPQSSNASRRASPIRSPTPFGFSASAAATSPTAYRTNSRRG